MPSLARFLLALFFMAMGLGPAAALTTPWLDHEQARVRLLAAGGGQSDGQSAEELRLGLQFSLEPGWKIYWRTPGAAGIPPVLDWSGSDNLSSAEMRWPAPRRFTLFGLDTFGYSGEVVLPIHARAELVSMVFAGRATTAHINNTATTRGSSELKMPDAAVEARCQVSDSPPVSATRNDTKASSATCNSVKALMSAMPMASANARCSSGSGVAITMAATMTSGQ